MSNYILGKVVGRGISNIVKNGEILTVTYTDGTSSTFNVPDGATGSKGDKGDTGLTGNGISSISLKSTNGKIKTYTILFTDGEYFDFNVTDGADAETVDIVEDGNNNAVSSNAVYDYVNTIVGDIEEDMLQ